MINLSTFTQSELEGQRERISPILLGCVGMLFTFALLGLFFELLWFEIIARLLIGGSLLLGYYMINRDLQFLKAAQVFLMFALFAFLMLILFTGGFGSSSLFIFLAMPFLGFYMSGITMGLLLNVGVILIVWAYLGAAHIYDVTLHYSFNDTALFSINFVFFALCAYFFETVRYRRAYEMHQLITQFVEEKQLQEKSEQKLDTANKAMHWLAERASTAKEKLSNLLDAIDEGYFIVDLDGVLQDANHVVCQLSGFSRDELIGRKSLEFYHSESDRKKFIGLIHTQGTLIGHELQMINKAGQTVDVTINARVVLDEDGKAIGIEGLITDITQQKETEKKLKDATHYAQEASKAKSRFLTVMSHELRTPIHGIIGLHEIMAEEADLLSEDQRENLQLATHSAKTLKQLVDDILDLSKIEAGKTDVIATEVVLSDCLQDMLTSFIASCREKGIKLELVIDHVPERISVDNKLLRQIFLNLLGNAIKFTSDGKVCVRVSQKDEQRIEFVVEDNGIGIPEEKQRAIFEPFVQIDNQEDVGTGLGMSIVRNFLELLGGEISVVSVVGQGSQFIFSIPVKFHGSAMSLDLDVLNDTRSQDNEDFKTSYRSDNPVNILLAEDDPVGQRIAVRRLQQAGFKVDIVSSGVDAWQRLSSPKHDYDLLLTDVRMPGMDGITLTRKVRKFEQDEKLNHLTIVGLSAHAVDDVVQDGLDAGMDHFMTKPVEPDEIVRSISAQMGVQR
ncbi:MAG: ATP-binding protein [Mariprofundaceae bacterium]